MRAREIASENLKSDQGNMKEWYEKKTRLRTFQQGDKVLVLFLVHDHPFKARY